MTNVISSNCCSCCNCDPCVCNEPPTPRNHLLEKRGLQTLVNEIKLMIQNEIKDLNMSFVIELDSLAELPNIGKSNTLYVVTTDNGIVLYHWDQQALRYNVIGTNFQNIQIIRGGNANDPSS